MRVARLHGAGDLRLDEEPDPEPGPGEELVRVLAVGLCGSDRHWFLEGSIGDATLTRPLVLGHEISGVIEGGPRHGTRVAIDPADPCGRCGPCLDGRSNVCLEMRFAGHGSIDGGLRSLMAWPSGLLHELPDEIGDAEAALLEPLGVAIHAADQAEVRPGMSAGVYGCGPIGLLLVGLLRAAGCLRIVATDVLAHRVAAARKMGATDAIRVESERRTESLLPHVDVAFEVAGEDAAVEDAIGSVRSGGRVVLVGIPSNDRTSFPASVARRKELTLLLCRRMTAPDMPRAIRLVETGRIDPGALISERHPLEAASLAFERLVEQRALKTVIVPDSLPTPAAT